MLLGAQNMCFFTLWSSDSYLALKFSISLIIQTPIICMGACGSNYSRVWSYSPLIYTSSYCQTNITHATSIKFKKIDDVIESLGIIETLLLQVIKKLKNPFICNHIDA